MLNLEYFFQEVLSANKFSPLSTDFHEGLHNEKEVVPVLCSITESED